MTDRYERDDADETRLIAGRIAYIKLHGQR